MIPMRDNRIGMREFIAVVILTLGTKLADGTPGLLMPEGTTATWMIPLFSAALILTSFGFLLAVLKRYEGQGLLAILFQLTGRWLGTVIGLFLFVLIFAAIAINTRNYTQIITTMNLPRTPDSVICLLLIGASAFLAYRGMETVGRTAWLMLPSFHVSLLLLLVLIAHQLTPAFLFPLGGPGLKGIAREALPHSALFGEVIFLGVLSPHVRRWKDFRRGSLWGTAIAVLEIFLFLAVYLMMFDYPTMSSVAYPFHELGSMVQVGGRVVNAQGLYLIFWIMASIVRYSFYLYVAAELLRQLLNLQESQPLVLPLSGLSWMLAMLPENGFTSLLLYRENGLVQYSWPVLLLIPPLLWLLMHGKVGRKP